jgi:hypothetical protein
MRGASAISLIAFGAGLSGTLKNTELNDLEGPKNITTLT